MIKGLGRVLIYKRTHVGDPDRDGFFGIRDCMGSVRDRDFNAVIGIGGLSAEPRLHGIAGRVTWVGVGARRIQTNPGRFRGPIVAFDRFSLLDAEGPMVRDIAPALAELMYSTHRRHVMSDSLKPNVLEEVMRVLKWAEGPPIVKRGSQSVRSCRSRCRPCTK